MPSISYSVLRFFPRFYKRFVCQTFPVVTVIISRAAAEKAVASNLLPLLYRAMKEVSLGKAYVETDQLLRRPNFSHNTPAH